MKRFWESQLGAPAILMTAFAFMSWASWRRWAELIIDLGQQLYVPWVISEGDILYRDVAYLHGSLPSLFHALVFKITGPGLFYIEMVNLALVAGLCLLIYHWIAIIADRATGVTAGLTFIGAFAFANYWGMGLLNWIVPYIYDLTHGIILSFISLFMLYRYTLRPSMFRLSALGLMLGFIFLTKMEAFLAAGVALTIGLLLVWHHHRLSWKRIAMRTCVFTMWAMIPPLAVAIYFSMHMPVKDVFFHIAGAWIYGLDPRVRDLLYYKLVSGTLHLKNNLLYMVLIFIMWAVIVLLLTGWNRYVLSKGWVLKRCSLYSAGIISIALIFLQPHITWRHLSRGFPLMLAILCAIYIYRVLKRRYPDNEMPGTLSLISFAIFSLMLTVKVFINLNLSHMGFALALPATLVMLIMLLHRVPQALKIRGQDPTVFRACAFSLVLTTVFILANMSIYQYSNLTYPVGQEVDLIYDTPPDKANNAGLPPNRAPITEQALAFLEHETQPDDTILSLPDAMIINYLTRRRFPTRDTIFNPLTWILTADSSMLDRLNASPPKYIVYVDAQFAMHGSPMFGIDYGWPLTRWVQKHYTLIRQFGEVPNTHTGFGIQILKRNEAETSTERLDLKP